MTEPDGLHDQRGMEGAQCAPACAICGGVGAECDAAGRECPVRVELRALLPADRAEANARAFAEA